MPTATTVLTFSVAALTILLIPGPSVAYVVACSIEHGRAAGLCSVLGLETGALLHVVGAALGLGTLLASSPGTFLAVRYAGACYLLLLGVRQFIRRDARSGGARHRAVSRSLQQVYRDGVLVDLLNPKTAIFFLAFLPQFVGPAQGSGTLQILFLGGCFVVLAACCDAAYALAAGGLARKIRESLSLRRGLQRTTGGIYLTLAGLAAFT